MPVVKTAISVDQDLFRQAEQMAKSTKVSRSRLYCEALRKHVAQWQDRLLIEQINAAYDDYPDADEKAFLDEAADHFADVVETP